MACESGTENGTSSTHFSWNMSRVLVHACKETAERRTKEKVSSPLLQRPPYHLALIPGTRLREGVQHGMSSCRYRCRSRRSRYWLSETWRAPCLGASCQLRLRAGARPDHPISGNSAVKHPVGAELSVKMPTDGNARLGRYPRPTSVTS
jgi:hypothetical protein